MYQLRDQYAYNKVGSVSFFVTSEYVTSVYNSRKNNLKI